MENFVGFTTLFSNLELSNFCLQNLLAALQKFEISSDYVQQEEIERKIIWHFVHKDELCWYFSSFCNFSNLRKVRSYQKVESEHSAGCCCSIFRKWWDHVHDWSQPALEVEESTLSQKKHSFSRGRYFSSRSAHIKVHTLLRRI